MEFKIDVVFSMWKLKNKQVQVQIFKVQVFNPCLNHNSDLMLNNAIQNCKWNNFELQNCSCFLCETVKHWRTFKQVKVYLCAQWSAVRSGKVIFLPLYSGRRQGNNTLSSRCLKSSELYSIDLGYYSNIYKCSGKFSQGINTPRLNKVLKSNSVELRF